MPSKLEQFEFQYIFGVMVSTKSARHYTRQRSFSDTCRAMEEPLSAFLLNQLLNCGYYFFLPETDFADGNKKCGSLKRLVADRRQRAQDGLSSVSEEVILPAQPSGRRGA